MGLIGLANKESNFNANDAQMAKAFGELAAIALQNSIYLDKRNRAEKEKEQVIKDLKLAMEEIRTLSGFLPICSMCKKIRDDKGYWNQIEEYIREHSEAQFTHSVCPDCLKEHYPEFDFSK